MWLKCLSECLSEINALAILLDECFLVLALSWQDDDRDRVNHQRLLQEWLKYELGYIGQRSFLLNAVWFKTSSSSNIFPGSKLNTSSI